MNIREQYPVGSCWVRILEDGSNVKRLVIDHSENPDRICVITIGNQISHAGNMSWNPIMLDCTRIPLLGESQGNDEYGQLIFKATEDYVKRLEEYKSEKHLSFTDAIEQLFDYTYVPDEDGFFINHENEDVMPILSYDKYGNFIIETEEIIPLLSTEEQNI